MPMMDEAADRSDVVVFGGDMFDFRWTTFDNVKETVDNALLWLGRFVTRHPRCKFQLLLGNHDHHVCLMERLDTLSEAEERFSWHPYIYRIDDCVFLHGDVVDGAWNADLLATARKRSHQRTIKKSRFMNFLYDLAVVVGVHRIAVRFAHPHRLTAKRLLGYLDSIGLGVNNGVRCVVFGHTHRALHNFQYRDVRFFNGGGAIKGLRFHVIEIDTSLFT